MRRILMVSMLLAAGGIARAQVVARAGDWTISLAEVISTSAARLEEVDGQRQLCSVDYERNRHAVIEERIQELMREHLLKVEAAARKTTPEEVLAGIVARPIKQEEVDAFYDKNRQLWSEPKNVVALEIREFLGREAAAAAADRFYEKLGAKYNAVSAFEPLRSTFTGSGPSRGPASAPVTIVEFSDFQCPYCRSGSESLDAIRKEFGDRVRVVFRHFPLTFHAHAQKAAEASMCADEQGKFWEMHDALFGDQAKLAVGDLKSTAAALGMDRPQFDACLDSGKFAGRVTADLKEGRRAGVHGTPAFFVNGRYVRGGPDEMERVIQDELARTRR